jgi:hypothetical protein
MIQIINPYKIVRKTVTKDVQEDIEKAVYKSYPKGAADERLLGGQI